MASKETLVAQRGGRGLLRQKCIANAKLEMDKEGDGGADFEILDSFYDKLTEKYKKSRFSTAKF